MRELSLAAPKFVPVIVIVSPIWAVSGLMEVITGRVVVGSAFTGTGISEEFAKKLASDFPVEVTT